MSEKYVRLSEEDRKFIENYSALPDKERRFFKLLIQIGAARTLPDEDYCFLIDYLWRQHMKQLQAINALEGRTD